MGSARGGATEAVSSPEDDDRQAGDVARVERAADKNSDEVVDDWKKKESATEGKDAPVPVEGAAEVAAHLRSRDLKAPRGQHCQPPCYKGHRTHPSRSRA